MSAGSGSHADRLARGALLLQGAQVVRLVGGLAVLTLLARELSLAELGTYTILLSLITYVQWLKSSVMNAAVVSVAEAGEDRDRLATVVSTAFGVYAAIGLASGVLLAAVGLLALPLLNVPSELDGEAQAGVIGLAAVTALGWPVQIFDDLLRGLQRFAAVSVIEILAMVAYIAGTIALVVADAPISALVTWNAAIPLVTGIACLLTLPFLGVRIPFGRSRATRTEARRFGGISGVLAAGGVADLATYTLDRGLLSAIRSPADVGLYEGPLQTQNVVRYLNGVLTQPVVPAARDFIARGESARVRELFLRGLRYSLAATAPFAVVLSVLSGPVLVTWLGPKFGAMEEETTLFVAWWLIGANSGLAGTMLLAAGLYKQSTIGSWLIAVINVGLTAALTSELGIWGPIVAAVCSFAIGLAYIFPLAVRAADVRWGQVARQAWLPAYSTAALIAAALIALRLVWDIPSGVATVAVAAAGLLAYWGLYALLWLSRDELRLVRRTLLRR